MKNKNVVLYSFISDGTGKLIADELGWHGSYHIKEKFDVVLRWGNSSAINCTPKIELNKNIKNCIDKKLMLQIFHQNNIPTVKFWDHSSFRFVIRSNRYDGDKRKFKICKNGIRPCQNEYAIEYIPDIEIEYRLHVFGDEVWWADVKIPGKCAHRIIRWNSYGWYFKKEDRYPVELDYHALRAVSVLGLDFGAVDIGITSGGQIIVFEVNSAPRLSEEKVVIFAEKVRKITG